jgi:hypothetical protein
VHDYCMGEQPIGPARSPLAYRSQPPSELRLDDTEDDAPKEQPAPCTLHLPYEPTTLAARLSHTRKMGAQCTTMGERPIGPARSPLAYRTQSPSELRLDDIEDDALAIVGALEPIDEKAASHPTARSNSGQNAPLNSIAHLKSLHARGSLRDESTCCDAAKGGHLEVLQWAHAIGCPWDKRTCDAAARGGHLEVLLWARSRGCPWGASTCWKAARGGHLAVLQWLRVSGCPWNKHTCEAAAEGGHLEVLLWARAHGCPWNSATCEQAATRGDLAMLQYARANGCPWSEVTCAGAAVFGQLALLQWAHANGCPLGSITCAEIRKVRAETLLEAAENGDTGAWERPPPEDFEAVIVWLRANGCPEA